MRNEDTAYIYLGDSPKTGSGSYAVAVPYPSVGMAGFSTARMVNAARNANGAMVGQMVGRAMDKQQLGWDKIACEKWWQMNRWFSDGHFTFYCHYFDHNTGAWRTRLFYLGDVSAEPFCVGAAGGGAYYKNAKFSIIDCGVV